ncbi:unnamed protein product [Acanthosepion pharaonis]|uniref:Uncharacterized protein n=1 Tax=Acanthosepion pharaonis TaxID=158019 RepID=A0A812CDC8_ACAPH|nr:unnamed protein product [Sepia pharaonis]
MLFPGEAQFPLLRDCLIHFTCSFPGKALIPLLRDSLSWKSFNSSLRDSHSFLHALSWRKAFVPLLRDCLIHFTCSFLEKGFIPLLRDCFNSLSFVTVSFIFTCSFLEKLLIPLLRDCLIHFTCSFSWKGFNSSPSLLSHSFYILFPGDCLPFSPLFRDCLFHFTYFSSSLLDSFLKSFLIPLLRDCLIHFTCLFFWKALIPLCFSFILPLPSL